MSDTPATLTRSEFAAHNGWAKSYVTKLGHEGRLVLTSDGKRVLVAESLAKIAEGTTAMARASEPAVPAAVRVDRDRKEFYDAENARLDLEERTGKLMRADDVLDIVANVAATLRTRLESRSAIVAPQLAALAGDEARITTVLADHDRATLAEVSRLFAKLSSPTT